MLSVSLRQQCFLSSFYYFLPCIFMKWILANRCESIRNSSVGISNCLSSTTKPRSSARLWPPFHNNIIIWQLSGLCPSEVGSKIIHPDVINERRWLLWYNDYLVTRAISSANTQRRPPPAARPWINNPTVLGYRFGQANAKAKPHYKTW